MTPFSLDLRDAITIITGIVTIAGVIFTQRAGLQRLVDGQSSLQAGQVEGNRKIDALHKRMDHYGQEITRIDKDHCRLDERVKALKESQRFKLRGPVKQEMVRAAEQDVFVVEDEE